MVGEHLKKLGSVPKTSAQALKFHYNVIFFSLKERESRKRRGRDRKRECTETLMLTYSLHVCDL